MVAEKVLMLPQKLWKHPNISSTKIEAFRNYVNRQHGLDLVTYHDLWRWSTESTNDFWMRLWEFSAIKASRHPHYAISSDDLTRMSSVPLWFPESRFNFAQNILESPFAPLKDPLKPVITGIREGGAEIEHLTLPELTARVKRVGRALVQRLVRPLDRVACITTNSIDTFIIFLATTAIGAIFTACSPDLGEKEVLDRFLQVKPRILFADDFLVVNRKKISCVDKIKAISRELKKNAGLEHLVMIPRYKSSSLPPAEGLQYMEEFLISTFGELNYLQTSFSHPLVIVYASGTTSLPKCIVHTTGGVLIKQKLEQILCFDMNPRSVYFQNSSTDCIMYIYSISGPLSGARSVLYDGSPFEPSPSEFLDILAREGVTHFGTNAHYLSLLETSGLTKCNVPNWKSLQCMTSTGSLLAESQYHWIYEAFGNIQLSSNAVCPDLAGAFVGGAPNVPVYTGWYQARVLGMKVQIYSDEGQPIEHTGRAGELVCTRPFPSQPAFFWGDDRGIKYYQSYFERFPGVWHQGDYIRMHPQTQGIQFLDRCSGVIDPSGTKPSRQFFGVEEIADSQWKPSGKAKI